MAGGIPDDDIEEADFKEETATVICETSAGPITLHFQRSWSPNGYDRVVELFERGFYDETHFFRAVPNFLVQFGLTYSTDPALKRFADTPIPDDPQLSPHPIAFDEGIISFAGSGPNSRTSQLFIAYGPIKSLGTQKWETPVGEVIEGMENVRRFYGGYGDGPPFGKGPGQGKIRNQGRGYIEKEFPKLDHFGRCSVDRYAVSLFDDDEEKEEQGGTSLENTMEPNNQKETQLLENDNPKGDITDVVDSNNAALPPKRLGQERNAAAAESLSTNDKTDPVVLFSGFLGVILVMLLIVLFKSKNTGVKKSV